MNLPSFGRDALAEEVRSPLHYCLGELRVTVACTRERTSVVSFHRNGTEGTLPVRILTEFPCSMFVEQRAVLQHSMQRDDNVERVYQKEERVGG